MSRIVHLSEAASIAIHAMVFIAQADTHVNVNVISSEIGASKNHLAKVLQVLTKKRFLKSVRGPSGGFVLNVDTKNITLLDIYEAIEGTIDVPECPLDRHVCPFNKCLMGGMVSDLTIQFKEYFSAQTLEKFINEKK